MHRGVSLACTFLLVFGLASCANTATASLGYIGDVEVSSDSYRLAQYNAYQQAADLASGEQDPADVPSFLKETIIPDTATGEPVLVLDYVEQQTLESLEICAAIETRFDELGGALTSQEEAQSASYAVQLWDQYGETYKANGISKEDLLRFESILAKYDALFALLYGPDGQSAVSNAELAAYLENEAVYVYYVTVPLYNVSSYALVSDSQKAEMRSLAQAALDAYNNTSPAGASAQAEQFERAILSALPAIYAVAGNRCTASHSDFSATLLTAAVLQSTFDANSTSALRVLRAGQAAAVQYSEQALLLAVRLDPIEYVGLDTVRGAALRALKGDELLAALKAYGRQLEHKLDDRLTEKIAAIDLVA